MASLWMTLEIAPGNQREFVDAMRRAVQQAMRSGAKMIVTGVSSRGTKTIDTYSLSGISAAHKAIGTACKVK